MNNIIITCPVFIWKIIQRIKYGKPVIPDYPKGRQTPKYMFGSPDNTEELIRALHGSRVKPSKILLSRDFFVELTGELREYRPGVKKDLDMSIFTFCGIPVDVRNIDEPYRFEF